MVVTEYGIVYAVHIITVQFGSLCSKVCECLLRKGPLSSRDISRFTELNPNKVKNVLYVLIQHNCIQAFAIDELGGFGSGSKPVTQFMVLFDNILHRVRFSKFSRIVGKDLGEQCGDVLDGLLLIGRLSLGQMIDRAKETGMAPDVVRDSLSKLVRAHYVERVPAPEPVLTSTEEDNTSKKRGPKSAKIIEEPMTFERRVIEAATPGDAVRFSVIMDVSNSFGEDNDFNSSGTISGVKRNHDDMESKNESSGVWRPNFEEFMRHLRHEACFEIVNMDLDDEASVVFRAMLAATRYEEKKVKTEISVPLSVNSIYEEAIKSEAGRNMTLERVEVSLDQLCNLPSNNPFVIMSEESYRIDFRRIIAAGQNVEVESVVSKRYGKEARTMFSILLSQDRMQETEKIAETAFIQKSEAPKILYKMWQDQFLHMQKLVMTGARQSTFLLWKVDKLTVWKHALDDIFHASLNLSRRLAHELDKEKELLSLKPENMDAKLKERGRKLRDIRNVLTSSRFKIDKAIMLFHDF